MDRTLLDGIARAVLYEGYVLYPYRPSSLKNAKRWTFGTLYPESWTRSRAGSDRSQFQMECLYEADSEPLLSVLVRFLQLAPSALGSDREGTEREIEISLSGPDANASKRFEFPAYDGVIAGVVTASSSLIAGRVQKLSVTLTNRSDACETGHEAVLLRSFASAHAAVTVAGGAFVSLTDPPVELAQASQQCLNAGVWPVLVGKEGERHTVLGSPIILPDYPYVAPESPVDLFDGTEIDEILTLRVLTLTDEERSEIRASDARARAILEHAESLPEERLMSLHGAIRGWNPLQTPQALNSVQVGNDEVRTGDRVRLRPKNRADIFDSALNGRVAIVAGIEQDLEDNIHLAVVVEDDPGRDLGELKQPGHRFFFSPAEVERL